MLTHLRIYSSAFHTLLLNYMRQLMRHQPSPGRTLRRKLPRAKHHIPPDGVCQRIHRPCALGRLCICVHPYAAEVVPEARLHKGPRLGVQRLAGRAQHLVHYGRGFALVPTRIPAG